jgi:hypothetical protein
MYYRPRREARLRRGALGSIMGVAYSQDLRERVMAAVDGIQ